MAKFEQKAVLTAARLAVFADSGALPLADWAQTRRQKALAWVKDVGLPIRRDEYWRYTDPASLTTPEATALTAGVQAAPEVFTAQDSLRLVFVDGVFDAQASDPLEMDHVEILTLQEALTSKESWIKDLYGTLEAMGQAPVARPLAALNTAMAQQGIVVRVTGNAPRPISIIYQNVATDSDPMVHHLFKIENGAMLTVLETGSGAARMSAVSEVDIAENGAFHHVRTQGNNAQHRAVTHCFANLSENSLFKSFTLSAGGALTRNECIIMIAGDNAVAHVAGAALGDGDDFHHDNTVFITHDAVGCESRQVFKNVLRNGATGVFQGKILVKSGAQQTDGYQISQALLLGGDSQFLAKPELEIYADDVICSHGSTSGAIDETALFYLQSRGVPKARATDLLTIAFVAQALDEIDDEKLAESMLARLEDWLENR
ncbi:MAG: SufD family Fe-S cluster assembly protein [Rhodobacteraceae bacterium]|nr:SufD family Fe-S cluster assembly protein [Paracoccaceae bacterium]